MAIGFHDQFKALIVLLLIEQEIPINDVYIMKLLVMYTCMLGFLESAAVINTVASAGCSTTEGCIRHIIYLATIYNEYHL